jgi:very-short-patch-repair endonuclease
MQRIPPELTLNARRLRREATQEERDLWGVLKAVRPRFTRQSVVDHYILDFACRSLRLAVELDGGHHALQVEEDAIRTAYLERSGWTVLRFWNGDVRENLDGVFEVILAGVARASTHPRPLPFREGS